MIEVIKKREPHFRVQIYDVINHKSRAFTIVNHENINVEHLKEFLIFSLDNYEKFKKEMDQ